MAAILIIDDELGLAQMSADLLSSLGHSVTTAMNGRIALDSIQQARPDLILLDVMMPIMSGIEVLQALKADARHRDIPVIVMSVVTAEIVVEKLGPLTAGFLQKPFTFDELKAAVCASLPEP